MTPAQKEKQRKQFMLYRDAWSKRKRSVVTFVLPPE